MKLINIVFTFFFVCNIWSAPYEDLGEGIYIQRNSDPNTTGKKIAIVSACISGTQQQNDERHQEHSYKDIVAFGTRSKELYAKKHGHDFIMATQKFPDCYGVFPKRELECAWHKLALISRILDQYDWVFWTDADSIILNFDITLDSFLDENFDIIVGSYPEIVEPFIMQSNTFINTGQVFYKNSAVTKEVILNAWKMHNIKAPGWEQARITKYLKASGLMDRTLVYSGKAFNLGPSKYEPGDFLVHMFAYHGKWLYDIFKEFETKYKYILDQVEEELRP